MSRSTNTCTTEICIENEPTPFDGDDDTLDDIRVAQYAVANDRLHDAALEELRWEVARLTRENAKLRAERDLLLTEKNRQ